MNYSSKKHLRGILVPSSRETINSDSLIIIMK